MQIVVAITAFLLGVIALLLVAGSVFLLVVFWCSWADERKSERARIDREERRQKIYAQTGILKPVDTPFKWP